MTAPTPDALASALPDHISYTHPRGGVRLTTEEVAALQAERLAEAGYVLVHTAPDEATVERLAQAMVGEGMFFALDQADLWGIRQQIRIILAALADTSAQARHTAVDATGGGEHA